MVKKIKRHLKKGFTLIEILIVVTILSILAVLVLVALDPVRQFAEARNAKRWSHVQSISTAIYRYIIDNESLPGGIDGTERQLGTAASGCSSVCTTAASACLNLSSPLDDYLASMPFDPSGGSAERTYYSVVRNPQNIIIVKACNAENDVQLQMAR